MIGRLESQNTGIKTALIDTLGLGPRDHDMAVVTGLLPSCRLHARSRLDLSTRYIGAARSAKIVWVEFLLFPARRWRTAVSP